MNSLAIEIQEPFLKIENWMKHQRKQKVKIGLMKYIVYLIIFLINLNIINLINKLNFRKKKLFHKMKKKY